MQLCRENEIFVAFGVGRTRVERAKAASLTAEDIPDGFLVRVQRRREVLLLLFDVVQGLFNIGLFAFDGQDMTVYRGQIVTVLHQGPVPHGHLACKLVEFADMRVEVCRPFVDDLLDRLAPQG